MESKPILKTLIISPEQDVDGFGDKKYMMLSNHHKERFVIDWDMNSTGINSQWQEGGKGTQTCVQAHWAHRVKVYNTKLHILPH